MAQHSRRRHHHHIPNDQDIKTIITLGLTFKIDTMEGITDKNTESHTPTIPSLIFASLFPHYYYRTHGHPRSHTAYQRHPYCVDSVRKSQGTGTWHSKTERTSGVSRDIPTIASVMPPPAHTQVLLILQDVEITCIGSQQGRTSFGRPPNPSPCQGEFLRTFTI